MTHSLPPERSRRDGTVPSSVLGDEHWSAAATALGLTLREAEILLTACDEQSSAAVAARLNISVGTVKAHIEHILRKLGVRRLLGAVCLVVAERDRRLLTRCSERSR